MELSAFVLQYGYVVVFLWATLEGESVLLAAGVLAHQGLLDPVLVALVAAAGGFLGDQCFYYAGRLWGVRLLARFPRLNAGAERVLNIARRHQDLLIVSCRFLYGLRVATPVTLGTAGVTRLRFASLNALGALLWGASLTTAGWFAGAALERWLGDLREHGWLIAVMVIALALLAWFSHAALARVRRRR